VSDANEQRERELKFDVPETWTLPDPSRLAGDGGTTQTEVDQLKSTYFDTQAHDLFEHRLTLRRRTGTGDEGWQLKVPAGLARTEIRLPPEGAKVPRELLQLTHGVRRGAPLTPIAVVRTRRDLNVLVDATGEPIAEIAVDHVRASTLGETTTLSEWREVEVELKNGDEALLRKASKWLLKTGATVSTASSKLARALDAEPSRRPSSPHPLQEAVLAYLSEQYDAIIAGDLALRRGHNVIHKTRVATRRYRSVLRVFGKYFDTERAGALDTELKWYAGVLGDLRDLQVLQAHLESDLDELAAELVLGPVGARLSNTFNAEISAASRRLETAMRSRRYLALLDELRKWRQAPPISDTQGGARKQLRRYVTKTENKYRRRLAAAHRMDDGDQAAKNTALHSVRKAAKRARYTAELSTPALGKRARKARKRAKAVQGRLGDRQDAVIASAFLRRLGAIAGTSPGENGFTYGLLLGRQFEHGHMHDS
jgi:CHAD domain-containing protein